MNLKQYDKILSVLHTKRNDLYFDDFDFSKGWKEQNFSDHKKAELKALDEAIQAFKAANTDVLDLPPEKLQDFDEYGDVFTADEWMAEGCRGMSFIPSDGSGYWANERGYSYAHPDIFGHKPEWATHVAWYNQ